MAPTSTAPSALVCQTETREETLASANGLCPTSAFVAVSERFSAQGQTAQLEVFQQACVPEVKHDRRTNYRNYGKTLLRRDLKPLFKAKFYLIT